MEPLRYLLFGCCRGFLVVSSSPRRDYNYIGGSRWYGDGQDCGTSFASKVAFGIEFGLQSGLMISADSVMLWGVALLCSRGGLGILLAAELSFKRLRLQLGLRNCALMQQITMTYCQILARRFCPLQTFLCFLQCAAIAPTSANMVSPHS